MALGKLCEALAGVDERRGAAEVAPLKRLFKLGTVGPADFVAAFRELRDAHAEGAPVEAVRNAPASAGRRQGADRAGRRRRPGAPIGASRDPQLWRPTRCRRSSARPGAPSRG